MTIKMIKMTIKWPFDHFLRMHCLQAVHARLHKALQRLCKRVPSRTLGATGAASKRCSVSTGVHVCRRARVSARTLGASGACDLCCALHCLQAVQCPFARRAFRELQFAKRARALLCACTTIVATPLAPKVRAGTRLHKHRLQAVLCANGHALLVSSACAAISRHVAHLK